MNEAGASSAYEETAHADEDDDAREASSATPRGKGDARLGGLDGQWLMSRSCRGGGYFGQVDAVVASTRVKGRCVE